MAEILNLPSGYRNKTEKSLSEKVASDPGLTSPRLRSRLKNYLNGHYALAAWIHPSASMIRYSFEDLELAKKTRDSYAGKNSAPRIIGILTSSDIKDNI